ncbi:MULTISPECIES: DUF1338 domain-containing protein [Shewanella]|uniref:2-oxoadipate dioxygenase/decarboxylase n=1 Tax=Shewanella oncorhynchi TaxID=2726434 RepID=A0ABX1KV74_9GAMM|nr:MULTISPECIES: DUF1338 domain-containing protein [Shewanella]MBP6517383.1 DUF1338 domain-containing protein [Shewanella sp.]MCU8035301.1 DUF1338 domain-containing protein [Shewanella sp. SM71]MCU8097179.1 DUF1338 domain-containing protein [Shewanella sp. SM102]NLQ25344.1 DUF1338 domain-containing protein [Shewanella oncorhynchi]
MHTDINALFAALWQDYIQMTPSAAKVHALLGHGKPIINDHIALRTFNIAKVNLDVLAKHFTSLGYVPCGDYKFEQKKLIAKHFEHPDSTQPKVFISELLVEEFSPALQKTIQGLIAQVDAAATTVDNFIYSGRHWSLDAKTYQDLLTESEYAAWVAAFGYRANHFTVSINHLDGFETLESVNEALKQAGFVLNSSGGEIKGSPEVLLEQSSTMADKIGVEFTDTTVEIPSCFYEFALRYPMANGELYTGFVAASADKIFESTNVNKA